MISSCNTASRNRIVSVTENKRTFIVNNNSQYIVNKVQVDGCYKTSGLKCDNLFEIINGQIENIFYVELKGSDISHAVRQLKAKIDYCRRIHSGIQKECHIVASKFPKSGTGSQVIKKKF